MECRHRRPWAASTLVLLALLLLLGDVGVTSLPMLVDPPPAAPSSPASSIASSPAPVFDSPSIDFTFSPSTISRASHTGPEGNTAVPLGLALWQSPVSGPNRPRGSTLGGLAPRTPFAGGVALSTASLFGATSRGAGEGTRARYPGLLGPGRHQFAASRVRSPAPAAILGLSAPTPRLLEPSSPPPVPRMTEEAAAAGYMAPLHRRIAGTAFPVQAVLACIHRADRPCLQEWVERLPQFTEGQLLTFLLASAQYSALFQLPGQETIPDPTGPPEAAETRAWFDSAVLAHATNDRHFLAIQTHLHLWRLGVGARRLFAEADTWLARFPEQPTLAATHLQALFLRVLQHLLAFYTVVRASSTHTMDWLHQKHRGGEPGRPLSALTARMDSLNRQRTAAERLRATYTQLRGTLAHADPVTEPENIRLLCARVRAELERRELAREEQTFKAFQSALDMDLATGRWSGSSATTLTWKWLLERLMSANQFLKDAHDLWRRVVASGRMDVMECLLQQGWLDLQAPLLREAGFRPLHDVLAPAAGAADTAIPLPTDTPMAERDGRTGEADVASSSEQREAAVHLLLRNGAGAYPGAWGELEGAGFRTELLQTWRPFVDPDTVPSGTAS